MRAASVAAAQYHLCFLVFNGLTGALTVNTYHHQGVNRQTLAARLCPTAFDATQGWLIEAAEAPAQRWVHGVQWHPERMADFPLPAPQRRLWEDFVRASAMPAANVPARPLYDRR